MIQRSIHLLPETEALDRIQELRRRFDPLADKLPAHITVVFPFESSWSRERLVAALCRRGPAPGPGAHRGSPGIDP